MPYCWKGEDTVIPITPKSLTGRTSGAAPYPLAEQIQYVAKDYPDFGGVKKSYFEKYFKLLNSWSLSEFTHFKVDAVAKYVAKGTVVRDLLKAGILFSYIPDN
jgi:CRISPR-associated protein Csd1